MSEMEWPPVLAFLFTGLILSILLGVPLDALGSWAFDRRNPFRETR